MMKHTPGPTIYADPKAPHQVLTAEQRAILEAVPMINRAMSKHTPGPWHMNMVSSKSWNVGIYEASGSEVATVKVKSLVTSERRDADARLIAAAPDLLEALRGFVEHGTCFDEIDMAKARAAIAKATGEQS